MPVFRLSLFYVCMATCLAGPVAAADALLKVTPEQAQRLGLRTAAPQPAGDAGRVLLQGQVVQPPQLLRVISSPVPALVEQVQVARGDAAKAGRVLLTLHAPQLLAWQREYQQARLQAELARQTAQRDAALLAEGIIPAARAQASQNQLAIAEATLREHAQLLQMAGVRPDSALSGRLPVGAPSDGVVVELLVQPGQQVEAGAPLLKFARPGALWIELQAGVETARRLRVGDVVRIAGCAMPARLVSINPQLDAGTQGQSLRAQWPQVNDCAVPQQRVQAEIALTRSAGGAGGAGGGAPAATWLVPSEAVLRQGGQDTLFVQRPGGFVALPVTVLGQQVPGASTAASGAASGAAGTVTATTTTTANEWTQVAPRQAGALSAKDKVVVQGAVALKGLLQGLGGE
jgi:biotin carboxyl carrier protein